MPSRPTPMPRLALAALLALGASAGHAAETIRVGYAAQSPSFSAPIDAAIEQGYFARAGLEVVATTFGGGARLHQAMISGSVDIGFSPGSDFAYLVKGAPEMAIGILVDQPASIGLSVINPQIKSTDDLKGRKIGVTSVGAYTYWFAMDLPHLLNWPAGAKVTPVSVGGAISGQLAALTTGQIDGVVTDVTLGLQLEHDHRGRLLLNCADVAKDVVATVVWAHDDMIREHPDALRRFMAAALQGTNYLATHREDQIRLVTRETGLSPDIMGAYVDITNPAWSRDGRITPRQLDETAQALVTAGLLESVADLSKHYTDAYLPK